MRIPEVLGRPLGMCEHVTVSLRETEAQQGASLFLQVSSDPVVTLPGFILFLLNSQVSWVGFQDLGMVSSHVQTHLASIDGSWWFCLYLHSSGHRTMAP